MDQNTHPAPFNLGDHLCYVGSSQWREPPVVPKRNPELVLTWGMVGVVILSSSDLAGEGVATSRPWRCQVQFRNGLQHDITPLNHSDFEAPQPEKRKRSSRLVALPEPAQEQNQPQGKPGNFPQGEPGNDGRDSRRGTPPETMRRNYCRARYRDRAVHGQRKSTGLHGAYGSFYL